MAFVERSLQDLCVHGKKKKGETSKPDSNCGLILCGEGRVARPCNQNVRSEMGLRLQKKKKHKQGQANKIIGDRASLKYHNSTEQREYQKIRVEELNS